MTTAVSTLFRVGDDVRAKYASDQTIVGEVVAVDGDDVTVRYEWDTIVHHGPALDLVCSVERRFIPDERFAAEVRGVRRANPYTTATATSSVRVRGGRSDRDRMGATVEVWRWEPAGERTDQRVVAQLAREAVMSTRGGRREKLRRTAVRVFRSEHGAGVATQTTYLVVEA